MDKSQTPNQTINLGPDFRRIGGPVRPDDAGQRVDAYLSTMFPFHSRAAWQKRLEAETVLISGRAVRSSYKMRPEDIVHLFHPPEVEPDVDSDIKVLYEEAGVMAVYKPGNLPMHENGPYRKNTLAVILADKCGAEWAAVHRLDRETSGLVLCAATPELRMQLATDLQRQKVIKEYLAIARGETNEHSWIVDGPIGDLTDSVIRIKKWVVEGGLPARTDFMVLERADEHVLLRAMPRTGRTNQIRIHAAYSDLPLVGDKLYHPDEQVFLDYFADGNSESVQARAGFPRHCLHAASLTFKHPGLKKERTVTSAMPADMAALWASLTKSESCSSTEFPLVHAADQSLSSLVQVDGRNQSPQMPAGH